MEHIRSRSDRIGTQIEFQSGLLRSSDKAIRSSLVTRNVHISTGLRFLSLHAIHVHSGTMCIMTVVKSSLNHLDISLSYTRFLGEFFFQKVESDIQVTVEEPAHQSEGEHIAALEHRLVVHTAVSQTVLHHRGKRTGHHAVGVNAHLAQIVFGGELRFLQILRTERIRINNDSSLRFSKFILSFESCSIHSHEHVGLIARGKHLTCTDMNLKS